MLLKKVSGNSDIDIIIQLAEIFKANPWIKLPSTGKARKKYSRSIVEQQVNTLVESIGLERKFSIFEVLKILTNMPNEVSATERLLVAPPAILDYIPLGQRVKAISDYLEEILRRAGQEVLLLSPFWDIATIINILRCVPERLNQILS